MAILLRSTLLVVFVLLTIGPPPVAAQIMMPAEYLYDNHDMVPKPSAREEGMDDAPGKFGRRAVIGGP